MLFANGFRPFFLLGAIYAGFAILVWLPVFYGELTLISAFVPRDWHVHEMLYGYPAGGDHRVPVHRDSELDRAAADPGRPLMALVAVWIAGRLCVTFSAETGWLAAMLVDTSFLLLVAAGRGPRDHRRPEVAQSRRGDAGPGAARG